MHVKAWILAMKKYNIPIFISHFGCPHTCVFCNQNKITGKETDVTVNEIKETVSEYLETLPENADIEIAFFGGTFTGIPLYLQNDYLETASAFIKSGEVKGIRLSTRPDYITDEIVTRLKKYGVTTIELGVQSFDKKVLKLSERGYESSKIKKACIAIKKQGINLGIQLMPGLPGSTKESDLNSAKLAVEEKPNFVRIYPALVISNTKLERMYEAKEFSPLTLEEAVTRVMPILALFELNSIRAIRVGLHPSDDLREEDVIIAGPFHSAFRELVETKIYGDFLDRLNSEKIEVKSNERNISKIVGLKKANKIRFGKRLTIKIHEDLLLNEIMVNDKIYTREDILMTSIESGTYEKNNN